MKVKTAVGWTGLMAIPVFFLLAWVVTQGVAWQRETGDLAKFILFLCCIGTVLLALLLCFCLVQACRWVAWDPVLRAANEQSEPDLVFKLSPGTTLGGIGTMILEEDARVLWAIRAWDLPLTREQQKRVLGLLGEARSRLDAAHCDGRLVGRDHELATRIDTELALIANSGRKKDVADPTRNDDGPTGPAIADAVSQGDACAVPCGDDVPKPGGGYKR
jgi:hypothetical protein